VTSTDLDLDKYIVNRLKNEKKAVQRKQALSSHTERMNSYMEDSLYKDLEHAEINLEYTRLFVLHYKGQSLNNWKNDHTKKDLGVRNGMGDLSEMDIHISSYTVEVFENFPNSDGQECYIFKNISETLVCSHHNAIYTWEHQNL